MESKCNRVEALRLAICLVVVAVVASLPLSAQEGHSTGVLMLRLIVPEADVCIGTSKLALEVVFSNTSDSSLSIYRSAIYDFHFTKTIISGKKLKFEAGGKTSDPGTGDPARHETPLVLPPHVSIVVPMQYDISDSFFRESGNYSLRIRYMKIKTHATAESAAIGDFASNSVRFDVNECK